MSLPLASNTRTAGLAPGPEPVTSFCAEAMPENNRQIARPTPAGRRSPACMSSLKMLEKRCEKLGKSVTDGLDVRYDRTTILEAISQTTTLTKASKITRLAKNPRVK